MAGREPEPPQPFIFGGITELSALKVSLVLLKNLPVNFFPGTTWGLVTSTPSVFSEHLGFFYWKLKPPLVSSPVLPSNTLQGDLE